MQLANLLAPLAPGAVACDYPSESNVLLGVSYGSGAYTGSLLCPGGTVDPDPARYSPAVILQRLIIQLGLGTLPAPSVVGDWPTYYSSTPDLPDSLMVTYDTTAQDDGRSQFSGERYQHPGVQVKLRGLNHNQVWAKAKAVAKVLDEEVYNELVVINDTTYRVHSISRVGDILDLGKESPTSKRTIMVFNLKMAIRCEHLPA